MKAACVLLALLAVSEAINVAYSGNTTFTGQDAYNFRFTTLSSFDTGVNSGVTYVSISSSAAAGTTAYYNVFYTGLLTPPSQYSTFYESTGGFDTSASGVLTGSAAGSAAFISTTYLGLEEITPAGAVVNTVDFSSRNQLTWGLMSSNNGAGGLRTAVLAGTSGGAFQVDLTAVYSDKVGVLNVTGSPVVTPLSVETIVEIFNYTYISAANHLRLRMVVGSGSSSVSAHGNGQLIVSGVGAAAASFFANTQASVNGNTANVQVTIVASTIDTIGNQAMSNQLNGAIHGKGSGTVSVNLVTVDFPAGAEHIVYDPTQGAGANYPGSSTSAASACTVSVVLMLLALLGLML